MYPFCELAIKRYERTTLAAEGALLKPLLTSTKQVMESSTDSVKLRNGTFSKEVIEEGDEVSVNFARAAPTWPASLASF